MKKYVLLLFLSLFFINLHPSEAHQNDSNNDYLKDFDLSITVQDGTILDIFWSKGIMDEGFHEYIFYMYEPYWTLLSTNIYILEPHVYNGAFDATQITEIRYDAVNDWIRIMAGSYFLYINADGSLIIDEIVLNTYTFHLSLYYQLPAFIYAEKEEGLDLQVYVHDDYIINNSGNYINHYNAIVNSITDPNIHWELYGSSWYLSIETLINSYGLMDWYDGVFLLQSDLPMTHVAYHPTLSRIDFVFSHNDLSANPHLPQTIRLHDDGTFSIFQTEDYGEFTFYIYMDDLPRLEIENISYNTILRHDGFYDLELDIELDLPFPVDILFTLVEVGVGTYDQEGVYDIVDSYSYTSFTGLPTYTSWSAIIEIMPTDGLHQGSWLYTVEFETQGPVLPSFIYAEIMNGWLGIDNYIIMPSDTISGDYTLFYNALLDTLDNDVIWRPISNYYKMSTNEYIFATGLLEYSHESTFNDFYDIDVRYYPSHATWGPHFRFTFAENFAANPELLPQSLIIQSNGNMQKFQATTLGLFTFYINLYLYPYLEFSNVSHNVHSDGTAIEIEIDIIYDFPVDITINLYQEGVGLIDTDDINGALGYTTYTFTGLDALTNYTLQLSISPETDVHEGSFIHFEPVFTYINAPPSDPIDIDYEWLKHDEFNINYTVSNENIDLLWITIKDPLGIVLFTQFYADLDAFESDTITISGDYTAYDYITIEYLISIDGYVEDDLLIQTLVTPHIITFNYSTLLRGTASLNTFLEQISFNSFYVLSGTYTITSHPFQGFAFESYTLEYPLGSIIEYQDPLEIDIITDFNITVTFARHIANHVTGMYEFVVETPTILWTSYNPSVAPYFTVGRLYRATIYLNENLLVDYGNLVSTDEFQVGYNINQDAGYYSLHYLNTTTGDQCIYLLWYRDFLNPITAINYVQGTVQKLNRGAECPPPTTLEIYLPTANYSLPVEFIMPDDLRMPVALAHLLFHFNLLTTAGLLIFSFSIFIITVVGLLAVNAPMIIVKMMSILLIALFVFMNILPLWAIMLMVAIILFSIVNMIKSKEAAYE